MTIMQKAIHPTLPASLMNKRTTKLFTKSENAKIQKRVAKTKILVK